MHKENIEYFKNIIDDYLDGKTNINNFQRQFLGSFLGGPSNRTEHLPTSVYSILNELFYTVEALSDTNKKNMLPSAEERMKDTAEVALKELSKHL